MTEGSGTPSTERNKRNSSTTANRKMQNTHWERKWEGGACAHNGNADAETTCALLTVCATVTVVRKSVRIAASGAAGTATSSKTMSSTCFLRSFNAKRSTIFAIATSGCVNNASARQQHIITKGSHSTMAAAAAAAAKLLPTDDTAVQLVAETTQQHGQRQHANAPETRVMNTVSSHAVLVEGGKRMP